MIEQLKEFSKSQKDKINQLSSDQSYSNQNQMINILKTQEKQTNLTSFQSLIKYLHFFHQNLLPFVQKNHQNYFNQIQVFQKINSQKTKQKTFFSNQNQTQKEQNNQQVQKIKTQIYKFATTLHQIANQVVSNTVLTSSKFKKSNLFTNQLIVNEVSHSKNYEVINLQLKLLSFKTQVCILNQNFNSPFHTHAEIHSSGAFANVYYANHNQQQIAVKCISLYKITQHTENQAHFKYKLSTLINVLKQYFLLLLLSQLQIGPHIHKLGGFDLILHDECIQFAMQKLYFPDSLKLNINQIKQNLFQMHMLKIVHRDIKPIHISYSNTYQKYVFLDFGSTDVINQKIGQRTKTNYKGTISYSSQQILQLLSQPNSYADLYYNDIYGLIKSLNEKTDNNLTFQQKNIIFINEFLAFQIILMKYILYHSEFIQFSKLWKKVKKQFVHDSQQIQQKILDFFSQLYPNVNYKSLQEFYSNQIEENIREMPKFNVYKSIFKRQMNHLNYYVYEFQEKKQTMKNIKFLYESMTLQNSGMDVQEQRLRQIINNKNKMSQYLSRKLQDPSILSITQGFNQTEIFIVAVYYSCLTENPHQIRIEDKTKIAKKIVKLIQKQTSSHQNNLNLIFKCELQLLQPISILFQYFLQKVWQNIRLNFKTQLSILSISTLCLLGYPASNNITNSFMIYQLIKSHQKQIKRKQNYQNQNQNLKFLLNSKNLKNYINQLNQVNQKIQYILTYWQCSLVFLIFGNIYHGTNKIKIPDFLYSKQLIDLMEKTQKSLMDFISQDYQEFWSLNKKFHGLIKKQYLKLNEKIFNQLFILLKSSHIQKMCQQNRRIKRWRNLMYMFLFYFGIIYELKDQQTIMRYMKDQKVN